MFHADNGYYLDNAHITSHRCKTNTVSQHRLPRLRRAAGHDGHRAGDGCHRPPARHATRSTIRKRNLYGQGERNVTPYHMTVEDNILPELIAELETVVGLLAAARRQITRVQRRQPLSRRRAWR